MTQDDPALKTPRSQPSVAFASLALCASLTLGFLAGWGARNPTKQYEAEWERLKGVAQNTLARAPGYVVHAAILDNLLEKRHHEIRKGCPIEQAYLPALFLFMREDALAIPDAGAAVVLDNIINGIFRPNPSGSVTGQSGH
jgi:hypothetical protein